MTKYHVSLRANATWLNPNCSDGSATASTGMTAQCTAQIVGAAAANADKPTAIDASALPAADGRRPWSMGPAGSSSICTAVGVVVWADISSQRARPARRPLELAGTMRYSIAPPLSVILVYSYVFEHLCGAPAQ